MTSPLVSVVIRCYNEAEHIGKLLHGLQKQSFQDFEVILVDSGSTDGTIEIAEEHGVSEIVYIDPADFSFGRALNYGYEAANGKFCVNASAHVYPKRKDWLERLVEAFEEDVALVYGKQRGNDVTTYSENQIFKQWFPEEDIDRQDHPFCNNANAAVRREVWEQFPYDEQLTGLEDVDWAKRVQKAGYNVSYSADAEIVHVHDETAKEVFNRYRREAYAHKQIIANQSFSLLDFVRLLVTNILSDYRSALADGEFLANATEIPTFRALQFWGTYRGFSKEGPITENLWQRFYYPNRNTFPESNRADETEERTSATDDAESSPTQIDYPESFVPDESTKRGVDSESSS